MDEERHIIESNSDSASNKCNELLRDNLLMSNGAIGVSSISEQRMQNEPIFCINCDSLALARLDDVPLCTQCLHERVDEPGTALANMAVSPIIG